MNAIKVNPRRILADQAVKVNTSLVQRKRFDLGCSSILRSLFSELWKRTLLRKGGGATASLFTHPLTISPIKSCAHICYFPFLC